MDHHIVSDQAIIADHDVLQDHGVIADLNVFTKLGRAMDMLIHSQGGYSDKVTVDGNINNPLSGFTTEELKALIDK